MRLIYPIVILFLLIAASSAQLAPDKERFDVVLHPGDLEERTLKVTNIGDAPIFKISKTQMSGTAKDYIFLDMPEEKPLMPQDKAEIKIYFALSPETRPGTYTGFLYLLDSTPPSLPTRIDFELTVIAQESYGIGMTIDDAKSATLSANAEDTAQFDLAVKNLGAFRDVASIDAGSLPNGWTVSLIDGEKTVDLPYDVPLDPSTTHTMKMQVQTSKPGRKDNLTIVATSLGNQSKNSSVEAVVDFAIAVRGYNVDIKVPEKIVTNKTYKGSFNIMLDVKEKVMVGIVTPPELMVIPLTQTIEVSQQKPGIANFTLLASVSGEYPIIFQLMDSHGIPMPEEVAAIKVVLPEGMVVLTGDDFLYSTIASVSSLGNGTADFDIITVPPGRISETDKEKLQDYSRIVILGGQSIVSKDAEKALEGVEIKRIDKGSLYEECWLFSSEIWQNGTAEVVLSGTRPADIFRAYQAAKMAGIPIIICEGNVTENSVTAIKEMTKRNVTLSRWLTVGEIGAEYTKPLQDAGVKTEEVKT
jgi:putative cell wall-binding protein